MSRLLQHLLHTPLSTRRAFPARVQEAIREAVATGEQNHRGEIRFVVEGDWPLAEVLGKKTLRERALEIFGLARVWDTRENTGLLIYVLLCEQRVEIVADRGLHAAAGTAAWERICADMAQAFRDGEFAAGSVAAVNAVSALLLQHFPAGTEGNPNELPDLPIILR
ncbi:MAG: TPM domain-containing protein [bacterium]|nr:TPM domain-containing protein [bacterium]